MVASAKRVLVVDDDPKIVDLVRLYLDREGYETLTAHDGLEALRVARERDPDLIVLDLMLPGLNGFDVCRQLREESKVAVIMLTARVMENDKLKGLDLGADDYVTKPFSPRELVARVRAVLRRREEALGRGGPEIVAGDVRISVQKQEVLVDGEVVHLTPTEFRILAALAREPGRVFTRSQIVERVLGFDFDGSERTVDVHVLNLRRKIERPDRPERHVRTVHGVGYRFDV